MKLKVHSIFESISGEGGGFPQGTWCTFIRFQGCNLQCSWCDTKYSQGLSSGEWCTVEEIIKRCAGAKHVLITGGEPLLQRTSHLFKLVQVLLSQGKSIQIETNGSMAIPTSFSSSEQNPVHWVIDYKCPSSGMSDKMPTVESLYKRLQIVHRNGNRCYLKWVVVDEKDLEFALDKIHQLNSMDLFQAQMIPNLISPLDGQGAQLKGMIEQIKQNPKHANLLPNLIFSVQLHKLFDLP